MWLRFLFGLMFVAAAQGVCKNKFGFECNSKEKMGSGFASYYGDSPGPCFWHEGNQQAMCFFDYNGQNNYWYECECTADCNCPGGAPPPPTECQSYNGVECFAKENVNADKQYLFMGEGRCFKLPGRVYQDGRESCYVSADGSIGSCNCGSHADSCKCGTTPDPPTCTPATSLSVGASISDCNTFKTPYCALSNKHTGCKWCSPPDANNCGDVCIRGLTAEERTIVLNKHNELRARVAKGEETLGVGGQPAAADMIKLEYEETEIEKIAQLFTERCQGGHDADERSTPTYTGYTGQNAAWSSSSAYTKSLENMVQAWYDEVKDMPANGIANGYIAPQGAPATGHYTQVVAGYTKKIGCGFIMYGGPTTFQQRLVCNYWPGGNYNGQAHYTPGSMTSSSCPDSYTNNAASGLCEKASSG